MKSKCCQAPRHHLFSDCCSDCKEWAEFEDEELDTVSEGTPDESTLCPPTDEEIARDLDEIQRERDDTYFRARLAPAIQALENYMYSAKINASQLLEFDSEQARIEGFIYQGRIKALRDALEALFTFSGMGTYQEGSKVAYEAILDD